MKVTLRASTGAKIVVWFEDGLYQVRLADSAGPPDVCSAVDLFEVLAELAGLDLNQGERAAEAMRLAANAEHRLGEPGRVLDSELSDPFDEGESNGGHWASDGA